MASIEALIEEIVERKLEEKLAARSASKGLVDLAKIGPPKRTVYRDARAGKFEGAVKIERRWYAPQAAVDAWIATHVPKKVKTNDPKVTDLDAMRERLGLRRVS